MSFSSKTTGDHNVGEPTADPFQVKPSVQGHRETSESDDSLVCWEAKPRTANEELDVENPKEVHTPEPTLGLLERATNQYPIIMHI